MPSQQDFLNVVNTLMKAVLDKILAEPKLTANKVLLCQCVEIILTSHMNDSEWCKFVTSVALPLYNALSNPTKMFPLNRYEEALKKLNVSLGTKGVIQGYVDQFQKINTSIRVPPEVLRPFVSRVSFLLLDEVQVFISRELREPSDPGPGTELPSSIKEPMSAIEKSNFIDKLGSLVRAFFGKALKAPPTSKMWTSIVNCLKTKFVFYPGLPQPVSSREFTEKQLWYNEDPQKSVTLCEDVVRFFECVEMELTVTKSDKKVVKLSSFDDLLSTVYANSELMNLWWSLTNGFFSDENAVYVMKLMLKSYHELSSRHEQEYANRAEVIERETQTALRTGLKN